MAREYLKALFDAADTADAIEQKRLKRDLGKVLVTLARFSDVPLRDLELTVELLGPLSREPGAGVWVRTNYLEACLNLYHVSGTRGALESAVELIKSGDGEFRQADWGAWHLSIAEVWVALAEFADTTAGRNAFLAKSRKALALCANLQLDLTYEIRLRMLEAFLSSLEETILNGGEVKIRGIRFPFGLRSSGARMPSSFIAAAPRMIAALQQAADRGQYAYRDALSELLSYLARQSNDEEASRRYLMEAVRLRLPVGYKSALTGLRTALAQAEDLFLLEALERQSYPRRSGRGDDYRVLSFRMRGINTLLAEAKDEVTADPLVLLARELEARGPVEPNHLPTTVELTRALRQGDARSVYALAAERAIRSHDMRRRDLGGRGGVVTVEDYAGLTGQTFVFKTTSQVSLQRDERRALEIRALLTAENLSGQFGVIEHIASSVEPDGPIQEVVSVRRYVNGRLLRSVLDSHPDTLKPVLLRTIEFLALFHAKEPVDQEVPSCRGDLRKREIGRWLKQVLPEPRRRALFETWIELSKDLPLVRRRDAHTLNWLVDEDDRILAVDLESHGCRPVGYELAQLTDDFPIFEPANLDVRRQLLTHYVSSLGSFEYKIDEDLAWNGYLAALAARAVGLLTDSTASDRRKVHGLRLLERMCASDIPVKIREWSKEIYEAWLKKSGLVDSKELKLVPDELRQRISTAMSFHLRHNPLALTSREGWMDCDELADALIASGHDVTASQLLIVAGAMGEPRFEMDGRDIRAVYGHSLRVHLEYPSKTPPKSLYHATSLANLSSIFEARGGLSAMSRQMVHLSDDIEVALDAATRRPGPLVALHIEPSTVSALVCAAHKTWLAPKVDSRSLRVMTVWETTLAREAAIQERM